MGKAISAGAGPAIVNDFLPGDPGSTGRRLPAIDRAGAVTLPASVVLVLLRASDFVVEHGKALTSSTAKIVGLDTLEELVAAGVIDSDTLEVSEKFEAAIAIAGQAVGRDAFAADVEAAERVIVGAQPLPVAGSFSAG
ncbi:MAG: hypothetical protein B7Y80_01690 [Hyphomicrobium sp. 32-62-53]|nr:MAG: hypothetical protein B7Z29_02040 [Hyphomicrobium sp. 12-62-95]OYY01467.1 MAG: hypothetical protein B7Y80_01690 [Hyphomicrobium sp. 32-62-53]